MLLKHWKSILLSAGVALMLSCSDNDNPVDSSDTDNGSLKIDGTVYLIDPCCWDADCERTPHPDNVAVTFIKDSSFMVSMETDDSSNFHFYSDPATYTVIVETRTTYPDTFFNVAVSSDTTLDLEIRNSFAADYLLCCFYYEDRTDSLTESAERAIIEELSAAIGGGLDAAGAERDSHGVISSIVVYRTPVMAEYMPWKVLTEAEHETGMDTATTGLSFFVEPVWFACLLEAQSM